MKKIFYWILILVLFGAICFWTIPSAIFSLQLIKPGEVVENLISFFGNIIMLLFFTWLLYKSVMRRRTFKRKHKIADETYEEEDFEPVQNQSQAQSKKENQFNPNNGAF